MSASTSYEIIETKPHRTNKLKPVPSFDTGNIFQIHQCIDEKPASISPSLDAIDVIDDTTDEDTLINIDDLASFEIAQLKDVIPLPIDWNTLKHLAFSEPLIISYKFDTVPSSASSVRENRSVWFLFVRRLKKKKKEYFS